MRNIKTFINENKIRIQSEWADQNPNNPDWRDATNYKSTLKMGRKQLTTYFSMGLAHTSKPTAEDVLYCLASDSSLIENARNFEDWASELGYDTDSLKAEKIYNVCIRQAKKLKNFLGEEVYNELLWEVERK